MYNVFFAGLREKGVGHAAGAIDAEIGDDGQKQSVQRAGQGLVETVVNVGPRVLHWVRIVWCNN